MRTSPSGLPLAAALVVAVALPLVAPATPGAAQDAPPASEDFLFTFTGGGWGHGVGMSQYGALGRAEAGHAYDEILEFYYHGSDVVTAPDLVPDTVRVRLARPTSETITPSSTMTVTVTGGALASTAVTEPVTVVRSGSAWKLTTPTATLCDGCGDPTSLVTFDFPEGSAADTVTVASTGREYGRGRIEISDTGVDGEMWVVAGAMSMDEYLYGLGEVPSSWPHAALQAQAVAGRSYATAKIAQRPTNGTWCAGTTGVSVCPFDVYASTVDQAYVGWSKEADGFEDAWRAGIDSTTDRVVTVDGAVVTTFYSSSNGGHTASSEEIWGGSFAYLRAKADPFDPAYDPLTGEPQNPNHEWVRRYTATELSEWLGADSRTDVGAVQTIAVLGPLSASGRVGDADVRIVGTEGEKVVSGDTLRSVINAGAPGSTAAPSSSEDLLTTRFEISSFLDVVATAYYARPVSWMVANDLTNGVAPNYFAPDAANTRGQLATFLWRFADRPPEVLPGPFADVPVGTYYESPVAWMAAGGITTGTSPTTFSPEDTVTRGQAATLLWRYAGSLSSEAEVPFDDVPEGRYFTEAVAWMVEFGITTGTSETTFSPEDPVTRGQVATFLWRLAGRPDAFAETVPLSTSMRVQ